MKPAAISFRVTKEEKRAFYLVSKAMGLTVQEAGAFALAEWAERHKHVAINGLEMAVAELRSGCEPGPAAGGEG